LDPKDKDIRAGISDLFTQTTAAATPGSDEWVNRGADIASRTGVTPDPIIQWSRMQLVSGDAATAAQAAQAIQRVTDANPRGTPFALDDKDKVMARTINDAVQAGTDPKVAVENARRLASMPDAEKERLQQLYDKKNAAVDASVAALKNQVKSFPGYDAGWFTANPTIPNAMVGEFEELRQNYFKLTGGNKDQADALAAADLKNSWGITTVNGPREFMQYAPEAMHPGLTAQVIRDDMEASAKGHTDDPSKVRLIPTPATATTGGQIYALGVVNKYGAYDVIRDARGDPIPYQVPDGTAAAKAAYAKASAEGMAKLKAQEAIDQARAKNELGELYGQGRHAGAF
jgi:hypothetical protein